MFCLRLFGLCRETSMLSLCQRWVDKSPEPVMCFHHWVIIFYSSSRPTPLSSAHNNNKSNQQGRTAQRKEKHHNSESGKDFHFSCTFLFLYGFSHHISALSSNSGEALSSWFVVAASVLFLSLDCVLWTLHRTTVSSGLIKLISRWKHAFVMLFIILSIIRMVVQITAEG